MYHIRSVYYYHGRKLSTPCSYRQYLVWRKTLSIISSRRTMFSLYNFTFLVLTKCVNCTARCWWFLPLLVRSCAVTSTYECLFPGAYPHSANCRDYTPRRQMFLWATCAPCGGAKPRGAACVLHVCCICTVCRGVYVKYINGHQAAGSLMVPGLKTWIYSIL